MNNSVFNICKMWLKRQKRLFTLFLYRKRTYVVIFIIWIILGIVYYYLFLNDAQWPKTKNYLDRTFSTGFAVSFSASILDDLIIFLILTYFVNVLTSKKLWQYSFHEKVRALINSENAKKNEKIENFLEYSVAKLLAYDKNCDIRISINDYNESHSAFKIFVHFDYLISNVCRDKEYEFKSYTFFVSASDVVVNNETGAVTQYEIHYPKKNKIKHIINPKEPFLLTKEFSEITTLDVGKNDEIQLKLGFNTWTTTAENTDGTDKKFLNFFSNNRFCENCSIILTNYLRYPVTFMIYDFENQKDIVTLHYKDIIQPGEENKRFPIPKSLYPGDDVRIFFAKLSNNH